MEDVRKAQQQQQPKAANKQQDDDPLARVNFEANLNKTQVVQLSSERSQQPGFYCKACDLVFRDSASFLAHETTRLRMYPEDGPFVHAVLVSLCVLLSLYLCLYSVHICIYRSPLPLSLSHSLPFDEKRSTQHRILPYCASRHAGRCQGSTGNAPGEERHGEAGIWYVIFRYFGSFSYVDFDKRLEYLKEEEELEKQERKERKREAKRRKQEEDEDLAVIPTGEDADVAAMFGFTGFGTSKKK